MTNSIEEDVRRPDQARTKRSLQSDHRVWKTKLDENFTFFVDTFTSNHWAKRKENIETLKNLYVSTC